MSDDTIGRASAGALIGAGIAIAIFWLLTLPLGTFVGAARLGRALARMRSAAPATPA